MRKKPDRRAATLLPQSSNPPFPHSSSARLRRAFTLVELLAVIAIIGVIAALLFPTLGRVTDRNNEARCRSNIRQWAAGVVMYASDNDGELPEEGMGSGGLDILKPKAWFNSLAPYMGTEPLSNSVPNFRAPNPGDDSVFVCPALHPRDVVDETGAKLPYNRRTAVFSYGYNLWIDHSSRSGAGVHPDTRYAQRLRMSQVTKPAKFVLFGEGARTEYDNMAAMYLRYRHNETNAVNIALADGHAETFDRTEVFVSDSGANAKKINRGVIWDPEGTPDQWDASWQ